MLAKLQRAGQILSRRGLGYGFYLITGVALPRLTRRILASASPRGLGVVAKVTEALGALILVLLVGIWIGLPSALAVAALALLALTLGPLLLAKSRIRRTLEDARSQAAVEPSDEIPTWESWPVAEETRRAVEAKLAESDPGKDPELVLGRIDRDGLLATDLGDFPGFDTIPWEDFRPRQRFDLDLVLADGRPLLRKNFRDDRDNFSREWTALARLAGKARVPAVARVDEARSILYRSLVPGRPLNDLLVAAGARIRDAQLEGDQELAPLSTPERLEAVLARGRELLPQVVEESFFHRLEGELDRIHRQGVTGLSLTFGNLTVTEDGQPWLFDFDGAQLHSKVGSAFFDLQRDRDRRKYNRIFGRQAMTEAKAQEILRPLDGDYSPLDLGRGLTTRGFWSVDSGTGRWDYLNGAALERLLPGARILDLGSHNGIMPLLMLREGARQVVGVEREPQRVEMAGRLRQVFSWRHLRPFDLEVHAGDMGMILDSDLGSFDVVTAFCSLYYLPEEEMAAIVERAAELAPVLVVQAKTDTRQEAADNKAEKSTLEFLSALMRRHGFPEIETIAPTGFSRPLLIGKKKDVIGKKKDVIGRPDGS